MSNSHNRDYQGGWNGAYQQGGGGFAAHNVQHRYQEDDFAGAYPNQSQQSRQAPLYARGNTYQQRGSHGSQNYGSHRGHPQMGHHHQHHQQQPQQQRRDYQQYSHNSGGYGGNMNAWHSQSSSRAPSHPHQQSFGFNPNAPVFTPSGQFSMPEMIMQPQMNQYRMQNMGAMVPQQYMSPMAYCDGLDEETAAYEAMYSNQQESHVYIPSEALNALIVADPERSKIQEVMIGLEQIIADPDEYESWSGAIRERTIAMNDGQRKIIVHIMMEMLMSCSDPAVSMIPGTGSVIARLIETMAKEIPSSVAFAILPILQQFHLSRGLYSVAQRSVLLALMGHIFQRVETDKGTKIEKLGEAIVELMSEMLKSDMNDLIANEESMKDLIYTARVAGPGLDSFASTKSINDDLLTTLSALGKGHPKLSETVKNEISTLIEHREAGWPMSRLESVSSYGHLAGLVPQNVASSSSSSSVPAGSFIGPDGKPLTLSDEERHFLEEQFGDDDVEDMLAEMDKFVREEDEKNRTAKMMAKLKVCEEESKPAAE